MSVIQNADSVNPYAGKHWTIDVTIDTDEDGGIGAYIGRDFVLCTSCEIAFAPPVRPAGFSRFVILAFMRLATSANQRLVQTAKAA